MTWSDRLSPFALTVPRTVASFVVLAAAAVSVSVVLFRLTVAGALALYFVVWWIVLFAVLPFGAGDRGDTVEAVAGAEPGAPALPRLNEKAIWTTIAADVVFLAANALLPLAGL